MAKIEVEFKVVQLENDHSRMQSGVRATCSECDHVTESFGTHERSRKRCLVLMREECPLNQENFYVDADADDDGPPADPKPKPWREKR